MEQSLQAQAIIHHKVPQIRIRTSAHPTHPRFSYRKFGQEERKMEPRGARQSKACDEYIWGSKLEKDSEISDITHEGLQKVEDHPKEIQSWASFQSV